MTRIKRLFLFSPVLVVLFLLLSSVAALAGDQATASGDDTWSGVETKWGVKPLVVRLTGADHFLDFRYRVTDAQKAKAVFSRKSDAFLVDQATGKVLPVPVTKIGPLRASGNEPKENRNYTVLFSNVNKTVKKGNKVSIVIGDFKVDDIVVQ